MSSQQLPISVRQARDEMPATSHPEKSSEQPKERKPKPEIVPGERLDRTPEVASETESSQPSPNEDDEDSKPLFLPSFRLNNPYEVLNPEPEPEFSKNPGEKAVAAIKKLTTESKGTILLSDEEARDEFIQAAITATNAWAEDVLEHWMKLNQGRPNEFLKIFGWADGPKLMLIAIASNSPGAEVTWAGKSDDHMAVLKNHGQNPSSGVV